MDQIIDYMKIPSIGGSHAHVDISRDGKLIQFSSNETKKLNIYVQSTVNPAEIQRVTPPDEMVYIGEFSPDGKKLCYMADKDGTEKHDLFLIDLDNQNDEPQRLTQKTLNTYPHSIDWHPGGKEVVYGFTDGESNGLKAINTESGESNILIQDFHPIMSARYSKSGDWIACTAYDSESFILLVNRYNPSETRIIKLNETCYNASPTWGPEDKSIGFITNINGFFQPVIYELETGTYSFIDLEDGEESICNSQVALEIAFHPDGERIYYGVNKISRKYVCEYSLRSGKSTVLPFPEGKVEPFRLSFDGKKIVAIHSSMKSPGMAYLYDTELGDIVCLTNNSHINELDKLHTPESVFIESFDGRKIHAWYLKAEREDGERGPAIVVPHGGPSMNSCDEWFEGLYYQSFVLAGISVVVPNYRGSTGYGDEFFKLNIGDLGGGDLKDIVAAANWLQSQPEVDPERIGILGASYGGYLTLMALAKYSELFKMGVSVVPVVDWDYQYSISDKKFKNYMKYLFDGTPDEKKQLYIERSVPYHAEGIQNPLLVIAGTKDYRCPLKPIQDLETILNANDVPNKFVYKGLDGHMSLFDDVEEQTKDLFTMLDFMQDNL